MIGCVAAFAVARLARAWLPVDDRFAWLAVAIVGAMTVAATALREPHPFSRLGPANHVTLVRAGIVALLGAAVFEPRDPVLAAVAVTLTACSAVLDGVDGWLSRRTRMASAFGARIDMETDALLIMVLSLLVWRYGKAGMWVLAGGLMRYAFVAAMWVLPWMRRPLTPTLRAKTITIAHVIGLCVALAPIVPWPLSAAAVGSTVLALAWSFAIDVGRLYRGE